MRRLGACLIGCAVGFVATVAASAAPVNLEFWFSESGDAYNNAMQQIVDHFNAQHPDIHVDLKKNALNASTDDAMAKVLTSIIAGDPPDLAYLDTNKIQAWGVTNDGFIPMNQLIPRQTIDAIDWLPGPKRSVTLGSTWYGLPFRTDVRGLYFNQDMYAEVGLDPKVGPETIDQLDVFTEKLTKRNPDGSIARLGFAPLGNNDSSGLIWFWVFGGSVFDYDTLRAAIGGVTANLAAMRWIESYADRYGPKTRSSTSHFLDGKSLAMRLDSTTRLVRFPEQNPDLHWWVGRIPHPEGVPVTNNSGVLGVGIPRGAKHPQEAAQFALYLVQPDTQVLWYRLVRSLPVRFSALRTVLSGDVDPRERVMLETLPMSHVSFPFEDPLRDVVDADEAKMYQKQLTPEAAIDDIQQKADVIYERGFGNAQVTK